MISIPSDQGTQNIKKNYLRSGLGSYQPNIAQNLLLANAYGSLMTALRGPYVTLSNKP